MRNQRSEPPLFPGLTRTILVTNLGRAHIGREFVGLGRLQRISITAAGTRLLCEDGLDLLVRDDLRLDYLLSDEELRARREQGRSS